MSVNRRIRLNLRNFGNLPAIMLSQYDEGYNLVFEIFDGASAAGDLSGYTATLKGVRSDTLSYSFTGTISNNVLTFEIDTTMTGVAGKGTAEIVLTASGVVFATFNMPVFVEKAAVPDGSIDADVTRAEEVAEQIQQIVDTAAGTVTQSIAPEYDPTLTYAVGAMVLYENELYRCTSAIATPEAWTQGHWTRTTMAQDVSQLKEDLTSMQTATASDVGKALKAKTVTNGKVTEWEFGAAGAGGGFNPWSGKKICIFGDSIGQGYNNNNHSFVDVLSESGMFASVHKNCVAGTTTSTLYARLLESATEIAAADIIYAEYEANDIIGLKAGTLTTAQLVTAIRQSVTYIRNSNSTCAIVWLPLTIQHLSKIAGTDLSYYQSWVNAVYPVFAELGINMLPIFDTLNVNHASSDGRHPNDAGHEAIADLIMQMPLGTSNYPTALMTEWTGGAY